MKVFPVEAQIPDAIALGGVQTGLENAAVQAGGRALLCGKQQRETQRHEQSGALHFSRVGYPLGPAQGPIPAARG
jgi:hypothetical protein